MTSWRLQAVYFSGIISIEFKTILESAFLITGLRCLGRWRNVDARMMYFGGWEAVNDRLTIVLIFLGD